MAARTAKQRRTIALVIVAGALVLSALVISLVGSFSQLQKLQQEREDTAQELSQLQAENQRLFDQVQESSSDAYIIRMARRMLGWVFPDDIRVIESEE